MTDQNKAIVMRFNNECIAQGKTSSFEALLSEKVINHSAPAGMPNGKESFHTFINGVLRKGFPDLTVEILAQVADGDLVATRKKIRATHTGDVFGIAPTGRKVEINVIDIIRIHNGQYAEHWGQSDLAEVLKTLSA